MFWKIALGLGILGVVIGFIILIIAFAAKSATTDENTEEIAIVGIVIGILLTIGSFLLIIISLIFVLRASKKEFDAKNAPKDK